MNTAPTAAKLVLLAMFAITGQSALLAQVAPDAPQPAQQQAQGPVLSEIRITGLLNLSEMFVKGTMRSREGEPFSQALFQEDLKRLLATGYFDDITQTVEPDPQKNVVIITLSVKENLVLKSIEIEGILSINLEETRKELLCKANMPLAIHNAKRDVLLMREKYLRQGFHFATVRYETRPDPYKGLTLTYIINEGPKVTIGDVKFIGNASKTASDLMKASYSQSNGILSSTHYIESELKNDLIIFSSVYRADGWLDAKSTIEDISFSEDKRDVDITVRIEEGDVYVVQDMLIKGNKLFSTDELTTQMTPDKGERFNQLRMDENAKILKRMYGEKAYITATVKTDYLVMAESGKVNVVYSVREGSLVVLDKLNFTGNDKTKDKVLRRVFTFVPGEPIMLDDYSKSMERLYSTRYFTKVEPNIEDSSSGDPALKDITVNVEEGTTGMLKFSASYGDTTGVVGIFEFSQKNFDIARLPTSADDLFSGNAFAGGGQNFKISLQPGTKNDSYIVEWKEPYLFDKPIGLGLSVYSMNRNRRSFLEHRTGGYVTLEKKYSTDFLVGVGLKHETIHVFGVDDYDAPDLLAVEGSNDSNTFYPFLIYDTRDSFLLPTKGFRFETQVEYAGALLGGDFDYIKTSIKNQKYVTLYTTRSDAKHILQIETRLGWSEPIADSDSLPTFERFYAGGRESIRGFGFRTISPQQNGDYVGGEAMAAASLEYSIPVYREKDLFSAISRDIIRFATFVDCGTVTEDWGAMEMDQFRVSAGVGIRFILPYLGSTPLSFDYAIPLRKMDDDEEERFHFNLGFFY